MAKKEYARYEVEVTLDGKETTEKLNLRESAETLYNHFKEKPGCLVALYGFNDWDDNRKIRCNYFTKMLYVFYGSLSVIQILENEGINEKVRYGMTQQQAFDVAQRTIADHFKRTGSSWEYDLNLEVEEFRGKDIQELYNDAEHSVDTFEHMHSDFEDHDGSGNAQGYTSFVL